MKGQPGERVSDSIKLCTLKNRVEGDKEPAFVIVLCVAVGEGIKSET